MRPNRIQDLSAAVLVSIGSCWSLRRRGGAVAGQGVELAAPGRAGGPGACRPSGTERDRFRSYWGKEYAATAGTSQPSADQRFRIGSVTKTFTATIVLQLVEEGKLRLQSTLEESRARCRSEG